MIRITLLLALAACTRPTPGDPAKEEAQGPSSASCLDDCTSSITCRNVFSSCRFCGPDGRCSSTLPADPARDAGTDVPVGTAP